MNEPITMPEGFAYNLDDLQHVALKKHGLKENDVYQAAVRLFERGFISYPLTSVRELPDDMWEMTSKLVMEYRYATRDRTYTPDYKSPGWVTTGTGTTHGLTLTAISAAAMFGGPAWPLAEQQVYRLVHSRIFDMFKQPQQVA